MFLSPKFRNKTVAFAQLLFLLFLNNGQVQGIAKQLQPVENKPAHAPDGEADDEYVDSKEGQEDSPDMGDSMEGQEDSPDMGDSMEGQEDSPDMGDSMEGQEDSPDMGDDIGSSEDAPSSSSPKNRGVTKISYDIRKAKHELDSENQGYTDRAAYNQAPSISAPQVQHSRDVELLDSRAATGSYLTDRGGLFGSSTVRTTSDRYESTTMQPLDDVLKYRFISNTQEAPYFRAPFKLAVRVAYKFEKTLLGGADKDYVSSEARRLEGDKRTGRQRELAQGENNNYQNGNREAVEYEEIGREVVEIDAWTGAITKRSAELEAEIDESEEEGQVQEDTEAEKQAASESEEESVSKEDEGSGVLGGSSSSDDGLNSEKNRAERVRMRVAKIRDDITKRSTEHQEEVARMSFFKRKYFEVYDQTRKCLKWQHRDEILGKFTTNRESKEGITNKFKTKLLGFGSTRKQKKAMTSQAMSKLGVETGFLDNSGGSSASSQQVSFSSTALTVPPPQTRFLLRRI